MVIWRFGDPVDGVLTSAFKASSKDSGTNETGATRERRTVPAGTCPYRELRPEWRAAADRVICCGMIDGLKLLACFVVSLFRSKGRLEAEGNHFNAMDSGFHSPRRSLGAILQSQLHLKAIPRGSSPSPSNHTNFRFAEDGEARLTQWMTENLEYAIYPCDDDVAQLETQLIRKAEPPLNLAKWPNPQKRKIGALRNLCRDEARRLMLCSR
ncbi:MAG: GIY-YIG nuclease family protein [Stellaceae bacterium]